MTDPSRERQIAERAHARWEAEGRPDGRDKEHWSQAEAELGPAQLPEHSAPGEAPEPGATDAGTELPEALAQAGEGVPEPTDPRRCRVSGAPGRRRSASGRA